LRYPPAALATTEFGLVAVVLLQLASAIAVVIAALAATTAGTIAVGGALAAAANPAGVPNPLPPI